MKTWLRKWYYLHFVAPHILKLWQHHMPCKITGMTAFHDHLVIATDYEGVYVIRANPYDMLPDWQILKISP